MKLELVAVFASVLLVASGAAMAMPGDAPDHAQDGTAQADDHSQADDHAQADDHSQANDADAGENESAMPHGRPTDVPNGEAADAANGSQGPPVDLPEQVPDFVSDVHEVIGNHVDGAIEGAQSLGETISAMTPGSDAAGNAPTDPVDGDAPTAAPAS